MPSGRVREVLRTLGIGLLALFATSVLFVLCLPLGEQAYLAWVALVPLLVFTRGKGFLVAFVMSLVALIFAAWLSSTGILYRHHGIDANDAWIYTGFGTFGMSFALAFGLWGDRGTARCPAWWFAAAATLCEAILLIKLPAHLALSQYRNAAMVEMASVGGIWLVSFLIWWVNFEVAALFASEVTPSERKRRGKFVAIPVGAVLLFGSVWLPTSAPKKIFAALQIAETNEKAMREAQAVAVRAGATLAVWPEFGGMEMAFRGDTRLLRRFPDPPFVTSFRDDAEPLPHNVAALFDRGTESARYEKRKLFGEESKMHAPGDRAVAAGEIGLNICFDSCFPAVIRDTALLGASVVALPTTDPPSTNDFIAAIHAAYTPFRASESGVAFVRADSNMSSMIVDVRGKIVAEAPHGDNVLIGEAATGPRWTVSRLIGDGFLYVCGLLVVGWVWNARRRSR